MTAVAPASPIHPTDPSPHPALAGKHVLLVGAGGLGCPAGWVLARSGIGRFTVVDDDRVDLSNLHRQVLFDEGDAGRPKAEMAARRLVDAGAQVGWRVQAEAVRARLLPENVVASLRGVDLVVEGADNFATKFMVADACRLLQIPVVQAGAVRWTGWALAVAASHGPCLRCVFEDMPQGPQIDCGSAGVLGAAVGVVGSLQAALALRLLWGQPGTAGLLWSYRALDGKLRSRRLSRQPGCALCGGEISDMRESRYVASGCAA